MIKQELNEQGKLSNEQIAELIRKHIVSDEVKKYIANEAYFKGDNPTIKSKKKIDDDVPDNRVSVSYGRKVSLTTKNYMFNKPIAYLCEDEAYLKSLEEAFYICNNDRKVGEIGLDLIVHGVSYKLFYNDDINGTVYPGYAIIEQNEVIPVYSYDIEPKLITAIRYYKRNDSDNYDVEVYYKDIKQVGVYKPTAGVVSQYEPGEETPHGFPDIPLVVYGDTYQLGVFDSVKPIIDGIDKILSNDLNEIDKFELAYLVLTGGTIDDKNLKDIKRKRLFELKADQKLAYLLKQIDGGFYNEVYKILVAEIHKQTGVPDFASPDFAAESGIALLYKLMGFENLASDIEAVFKEGEIKSIELLSSILFRNEAPSFLNRIMFWRKNKSRQVSIEMTRNLPKNVIDKITEATGLQGLGVSRQSILELIAELLPVDVGEELKREEEEKAAYVDLDEVDIENRKDTEEQKMETPVDVEAEAKAKLKGTVGGVQGILQIQDSVARGITSVEAAISMLYEIYGFDEATARRLLGSVRKKTM